ncbi:MAG: metalloregulator ArsR/SmtB family transcription factor [Myxococcota bacterium]
MSSEALDQLVSLFKALADPTRLRMVGLLTENERCGRDLASELRISPATVSHHLKILRQAGLLVETRRQPYVFYALEHSVLQEAMRRVSEPETVQEIAAGSGLPPHKRKVLSNFFDGPRLTSIPSQRRKKEIVFEELLRRLPRRREYSEKDLNQFIKTIHPDFCTIRREFIMGRYMEREEGRYWLTDKGRAALDEGR